MSAQSRSGGAAASAAPSDLLAPLAHLPLARKGAAGYYAALLKSDDEVIRFGAYCQLLALEALPYDRVEEVMALCRYRAIKQRAFEYFKAQLDAQCAARVAAVPAENSDVANTAMMQADLAFDFAAAEEAAVGLFRLSGDVRDLNRAAYNAEHVGGWRSATEWHIRATTIAPLDPFPVGELYRVLVEANQFDLISELAETLGRAGLHPYQNGVFSAAVLLGRGDPKAALAKLANLTPPSEGAARPLRRVQGYALKVAGDAYEKLGNYQLSFARFVEMNRLEISPGIDPKAAIRTAQLDAGIAVPPLPPQRRDDVVMMLGFARSGTTLLELVLGAHTDIEAMEEPPTWESAMAAIRNGRRSGEAARVDKATFFSTARSLYYAEVARRRRKDEAHYVVDKNPMRTLYAAPMSKLLPEQKYIFCIRHPFDVVLSCFRQRFGANVGMENFRTFRGSIEFYDFTMSQWFAVHTMADPLVHYLKYDDLVTGFDASVKGVLDFMGVPWDEGVRGFAESADRRIALTPSYQKIRKGLSIGVQTYWRNYGFLFQTPEAKPLHKWAEFFGYETR